MCAGHANPSDEAWRTRYNPRPCEFAVPTLMEAEHLNQIDARLTDLAQRASQLRGYL